MEVHATLEEIFTLNAQQVPQGHAMPGEKRTSTKQRRRIPCHGPGSTSVSEEQGEALLDSYHYTCTPLHSHITRIREEPASPWQSGRNQEMTNNLDYEEEMSMPEPVNQEKNVDVETDFSETRCPAPGEELQEAARRGESFAQGSDLSPSVYRDQDETDWENSPLNRHFRRRTPG